MKILNMFTDRKEIIYFLFCVLFCSVFFVFVYNPIGEVSFLNLPEPWNRKLYTALLVTIGFILMLVSRMVLFTIQKHHSLSFSVYVAWGLMELVVFVLILAFVGHRISGAKVSFMMMCFRGFLDIVAVLVVPYLIATLMFIIREKERRIVELSAQLPKETSTDTVANSDKPLDSVKIQTNPSESLDFYDRSGRFVFATRASNVLYVESADNYCNIHYINDNREDFFILHNSMKNVNDAYAEKGLLRCHRCYMVNVDKVKFVKKVKDGLVLELSDTDKVVPVSKTYNDIVVKYFVK